jgi:outer membrane protein OmpA-like peptidoglycan-associated protein
MRAAPAALLALVIIAFAPAVHAACEPVVQSAADTVQRGSMLSSSDLGELHAACGATGAAQVVDALVARGSCDEAAQVGRRLGSALQGVNAAVADADECLSEQLRFGLDDLDAVASRTEDEWSPEAEEQRGPVRGGAVRPSSDLGTRGAGMGGSGRASSEPVSASDGAVARRRPRGSQPKYKAPARAATGMGSYTASPHDDRLAEASRIPSGSAVAWSSLSFRVWFDYDSAALRPEAMATLGTLAKEIGSMGSGVILEVVGHTDSTGSWWYNDDLSIRRASAVDQALQLAGVDPGRLTIRGLGESAPEYSNRSERGRARNRRVEFRFYKQVAQITR